jgi:hypothetical protein
VRRVQSENRRAAEAGNSAAGLRQYQICRVQEETEKNESEPISAFEKLFDRSSPVGQSDAVCG